MGVPRQDGVPSAEIIASADTVAGGRVIATPSVRLAVAGQRRGKPQCLLISCELLPGGHGRGELREAVAGLTERLSLAERQHFGRGDREHVRRAPFLELLTADLG